MSVSINSNAVLSANGTGVGQNLLLNGAFTESPITTYWYDEGAFGIYIQNGELVIPYKAGDLRIYYDYNGWRIPSGNFTVSFDARASIATPFRYGRYSGNVNESFFNINLTTTKQHFSSTLVGGSAFCFGWSGITRTADSIVYISNLKLERSSIITPFTPSTADTIFVTQNNGFIETLDSASFGTDYATANIFYEI